MRHLTLFSIVVGLALCALSWTLGLLTTEYFQLEEPPVYYLSDEDYSEIHSALERYEKTGMPLLEEMAWQFNISLVKVDYVSSDTKNLSSAKNPHDAAFQAGGMYLFRTDSGQFYEVVLASEQGIFTAGQWLRLFLYAVAIVGTVVFVMAMLRHKLRPLESSALNQDRKISHSLKANPIEHAIEASRRAQKEIQNLKDRQRDVAADHRDLLASVAHEFRGPLTRLQFANEMAMERTGEEQRALHLEANNAAAELDDLVRETLRYSRLSNLDDTPCLEEISVVDLLRKLSEFPQAPGTTTKLSIEYPASDVKIYADRRLVERALGNLISNALRYGQNKVMLSTALEENHLLFHVTDDGPGIAAIHHQRLFEPFYRAEGSRSRETGGFGLGLSVVKSICDKFKADVRLTSQSGSTRFTIAWPLN